MVCDGTLFAFGVMKIYLQRHFKCSDMEILMVGSVPCGVYLLVGKEEKNPTVRLFFFPTIRFIAKVQLYPD